MNCDIDTRQYAREEHSTTQALIYLLHVITRQLTQETAVLAYVCRLLKGFDIIDQNILLQELCFLNVDQTLYVWMKAFLTNRTQALRVVPCLHGATPMVVSHRELNLELHFLL